ncbi:hypothetical protein D3C80_702890 [compost metagenome]
MTENRQHRRRDGHRHRDHRRAETEQRVQPLHHQHQVDDVETGEHEQRRQQHQDHPAITELRTGLDHLRQAQVRALRTVKRHEQRAEHDAQRAGERGPERGQADARANEADGHGEEGEIAEEPERALARQFVGALVLGDEVDRMPLDDGFFVEAGHARGGLGVSVHDGLLLLEDHDEITAFFRVNDARELPCRSRFSKARLPSALVQNLWERACSRKRSTSRHQCWMCRPLREQARSHKGRVSLAA